MLLYNWAACINLSATQSEWAATFPQEATTTVALASVSILLLWEL